MEAIEVLYSHKLKRTSCRQGIIEVMMASGQALSEHEIRERLSGNYDRTTFYRSFKTLEEHKIVHKIVVDQQTTKYAFDNTLTHKIDHAHFFCSECQAVKCLDSVPVQQVQLPEGFSGAETEVLIKGTCANCKK